MRAAPRTRLQPRACLLGRCVAAMEETGAQWGDETTVGAGLPILGTLRTDLIGTGDKVGPAIDDHLRLQPL